jgi:hypothetical protein
MENPAVTQGLYAVTYTAAIFVVANKLLISLLIQAIAFSVGRNLQRQFCK